MALQMNLTITCSWPLRVLLQNWEHILGHFQKNRSVFGYEEQPVWLQLPNVTYVLTCIW